jgi:hypothetical protein
VTAGETANREEPAVKQEGKKGGLIPAPDNRPAPAPDKRVRRQGEIPGVPNR